MRFFILENGNWKGNWFPVNPNDLDLSNQIHRKNMGILNPDCDDAKVSYLKCNGNSFISQFLYFILFDP